MLRSPLLTACALYGAYVIITNIGGWGWLGNFWQKYQKAAPNDAQQIERMAKPVIQNIQKVQGESPKSTPTTTTQSTPKPQPTYGVNLNIKTPIGSVNAGTNISPAEQEELTRKDLGEK